MSEFSIAPFESDYWHGLDEFIRDEEALDLRWQRVTKRLVRGKGRRTPANGVVDFGCVVVGQTPDGRAGTWTVALWEELGAVQAPNGDMICTRRPCAEINDYSNSAAIEPEAAFQRPGSVVRVGEDGVRRVGFDDLPSLLMTPQELLSEDQRNWAAWLGLVEDQVLVSPVGGSVVPGP